MKKYKLKITHSYINAICQWLDDSLDLEKSAPNYATITVWVVMYKWRNSEQVRNLCTFRFDGEKKLSLKQEVAAALGSIINAHPCDNASYLGNYLRIVSDELHQFFNLKY